MLSYASKRFFFFFDQLERVLAMSKRPKAMGGGERILLGGVSWGGGLFLEGEDSWEDSWGGSEFLGVGKCGVVRNLQARPQRARRGG
jgi:hypothetical protein